MNVAISMKIQLGPQQAANFIYTVLKDPGDKNLRCVTAGHWH